MSLENTANNTAAIHHGLAWKIFKNASSQMVGRIAIAVGRLVIAGIIIRGFGRTTFGEYSTIFGLLSIAEWLADFGTTEIAVREVCRDRSTLERVMRAVASAKLVQTPLAIIFLIILVFALHYPPEVQRAAFAGALSLVFFGGVLIYRARFKAEMKMEREVGSETISVIAMIPMIALASRLQSGLMGLILAHVVSRLIFLIACAAFARSGTGFTKGPGRRETVNLLRSSAAIGFIGLLVGNYETMDVLLLSKLASFSELALYSGAQRLLWPSLMVFSSIAATIYPVASAHWPAAPARFAEVCQNALDAVVAMAGMLMAVMMAAPEFFLHLLGRDLIAGAPILRILALLCFVKAVTGTIGPMLYVVNAQKRMLQFIVVALAVKLAVLWALSSRYGAIGTALGALGVETLFATVPAALVLMQFSGTHLDWRIPALAFLSALAVGAGARAIDSSGGLGTALLAGAGYVATAFILRIVRLEKVQWLLRWKRA